jgi:pyruvate/2-oxoglutarate dehydrogenase complex dihydrolipoamide dehydrogenase (E3) component
MQLMPREPLRNSNPGTGASVGPAVLAELEANLSPPPRRNSTQRSQFGLVVIGAGPAGLAAAMSAAASGVRVALIERDLIGGDSLNYGSEPSKALIRSARAYADMQHARHYGAAVPKGIRVDFSLAVARAVQVRAQLSRAISPRLLRDAGVELFGGNARFVAADQLEVDGMPLQFDRALIATGAGPDIPDIPGLANVDYYCNESIFAIEKLPKRLLVIGGGPLGCELAQAFSRFGSSVIIVQDMPLFLPGEERDAAQILSVAFARDGIEVRLNTNVTSISKIDGELRAELRNDDYVSYVETDAVLVATGRIPRVDDMGLDAAGVEHDATHGILVDEFLCSSNPAIYAAGDACMAYQYAHVAAATAQMAVANALYGAKQRIGDLTIPWCTYTDPEIAHVGLHVREAMDRQIAVSTYTIPLHTVDRAVIDGEATGFVKIHVADDADRIVGATIVGSQAGELISQVTQAMVTDVGMRGLAQVIHPYPTQSSAIATAAQAWCRDHPLASAGNFAAPLD